MEKFNLSVGILSWKSPKTLYNTLMSYKNSKLLEMVNDVTIFFQEYETLDQDMADFFGVNAILSTTNIGIGKALKNLAENAETDNILLLENDWVNIENEETTRDQLSKGLTLLTNSKSDMIKYRHRKIPGDPLYSRVYNGREMDSLKHLFECVHWREHPHRDFPDYIWVDEDTGYYCANSKYANHTNNPTMFKKEFYINYISPFSGEGIDLEGKIDGWWQEQNYVVSHGEGLFTHVRLDR